MEYHFKFWQEMTWVVVIAIGFQTATVLATFDPAKITDWRSWAIALAGSCVRAAAGALLAAYGAKKGSGS